MTTLVDAKRQPQSPEDAIALLEKASRVIVARGKKLVEFDMKKTAADDEALLRGVIGPSGKLRAPTAVVGKRVLVGFHPDAYEEAFG